MTTYENLTMANATAIGNGSMVDEGWTEKQIALATLLQRVYIAAISIISSSAIITNILVLLAMYKYTPLRTVTNRFVVSLSMADLLVGSCFIITLALSTMPELLSNTIACAIRTTLPQTAFQVSLFNLLGIAIDRYIAVMFPLHYNAIMIGKQANRMIMVMWLYAVSLVFIPMIFTHNPVSTENPSCYVEFFLNKYHLLAVFLHYWLGALTMTFIYTRIFRTTSAHIRRLERQTSAYYRYHYQQREVERRESGSSVRRTSSRASTSSHTPGSISSQLRQTVKVFSLVFGTFFICLTPYYSMYIMIAFTYSPQDDVGFNMSFIWLPLTDVLIALNSTINPYIYAWKYTDFRIAFKNLLCCRSQYQYNMERSNSMYGEAFHANRKNSHNNTQMSSISSRLMPVEENAHGNGDNTSVRSYISHKGNGFHNHRLEKNNSQNKHLLSPPTITVNGEVEGNKDIY